MTSLMIIASLQLATLSAQADQFEAAYQRSLATERPLVVLLGAKWCPGCVTMKDKVMPKVQKSGALAKVEYVYVDIDQRPDLAAKLSQAKTIPQLIHYHKTPDGWRLNVLNGAYGVEQVKTFLETGSAEPLTAAQPVKHSPKGVKK